MLQTAELGHVVSRSRYAARLPRLRARLLSAHLALRARNFPVIVIVSGADGAGKGELVQRLNEWLDPRGVSTHAFWTPSDEEREHPEYWRFWRALPGRGRLGIFFGSWYTTPIIRRVFRKLKAGRFDTALERIAAFERMLADDGALVIKFWLHLPKRQQKRRLDALEKRGRLAPDDRRTSSRPPTGTTANSPPAASSPPPSSSASRPARRPNRPRPSSSPLPGPRTRRSPTWISPAGSARQNTRASSANSRPASASSPGAPTRRAWPWS